MNVISNFAARYERTREEEMSLEDYLAECKRNPLAYATAAERMLRAIGEPTMVDTRNDPRLSRLFANKVIKVYPAFAEFYGMEDAIEQVVSYFRHAAQGLEEKKQILYLLGPVGGGKSSIAERLKQLMQEVPFYAIKGSPVNESPLGLFDPVEDGRRTKLAAQAGEAEGGHGRNLGRSPSGEQGRPPSVNDFCAAFAFPRLPRVGFRAS